MRAKISKYKKKYNRKIEMQCILTLFWVTSDKYGNFPKCGNT